MGLEDFPLEPALFQLPKDQVGRERPSSDVDFFLGKVDLHPGDAGKALKSLFHLFRAVGAVHILHLQQEIPSRLETEPEPSPKPHRDQDKEPERQQNAGDQLNPAPE